ncbi:MAG: hypothetical protein ACRD0B_02475, partial [Acidimicrobiales bacterium]
SGAAYVETLTGFKWIARAAEQVPGGRFSYGYEEALGYCVGEVVRDKDGIGASLAFLGLVTAARQEGRSVLDLLDELEIRYGVHLTAQASIRSTDPGAQMAALRRDPPAELGGRAIVGTRDYAGGTGGASLDGAGGGPLDGAGGAPAGGTALPPSDVLAYHLDGARVTLRPSGTEPKLKIYFEVVRPVAAPGDLGAVRAAAGDELRRLEAAVGRLLETGTPEEAPEVVPEGGDREP